MTPEPTLNDLGADLSRALTLPSDVRRRLALQALTIAHALAVVEPGVDGARHEAPIPMAEAARRLSMSAVTLRHRRHELPYATFRLPRAGKQIMYDPDRIAAYLRDPEGYCSQAGSTSAPPIGPAPAAHGRPLTPPGALGTSGRAIGRWGRP
jgi:hypothetical protein